MPHREIYILYFLRRLDKVDPYEPDNWQPFYAGIGKPVRVYDHRKEALNI